MAFKVLTYSDPYSLYNASFWDEIKRLPHLCVARTQVNGLVSIMRDSIEGLICPIDNLVEKIYPSWEKNVSLQIEQFSYLTKQFQQDEERWTFNGKEEFFRALRKNQGDFLEAIRIFQELGISYSSLFKNLANTEQRYFIHTLQTIQSKNIQLFNFPQTPCLAEVKKTIEDCAHKEKDDYIRLSTRGGDNSRIAWYDRMIKATKESRLSGIVIHGVHQFSPTQLRLIVDLEKMGLTVYFLYNYREEYREIYESWNTIYSNFDAGEPIHSSVDSSTSNHSASHALGVALGRLFKGNYSPSDPATRSCYDQYKSIDFVEFQNMSEYADYIAGKVYQAESEYRVQKDADEPMFNGGEILAKLDEQVYTANRDIHELLNLYFPEFSHNRHFLSYPIGQFFAGLYRLWDWEKREIRFELPIIRECLGAPFFRPIRPAQLVKTSYTLDAILEKVTSFTQFEIDIKGKYLSLYKEVTMAQPGSYASEAKRLSIYDSKIITREDINSFIKAIEQLNNLGTVLFGTARDNYIQFGKHFSDLEQYIKSHQADLALAEEQTLIQELLARFESLNISRVNTLGTFDDLKTGIYYYLRQKQEEARPDWIVKNFAQIDGDILQSKKQHDQHIYRLNTGESTKEKTYHFGCLSDREMNIHVDTLLPWPLTSEFLLRAYTPFDLPFRVYYAALTERSGFLRYALFYGLFFNYSDVKLSYVKEIDGDESEYYSFLKLLGFSTKISTTFQDSKSSSIRTVITAEKPVSINAEAIMMSTFMLCPHRYFLGYIVNKAPIANNAFLFQKRLENSLIKFTAQKCAGLDRNTVNQKLSRFVDSVSQSLTKYYFFFSAVELSDIKRRVVNYCRNNMQYDRNGRALNIDLNHIELRNEFGVGKVFVDITDYEPINPYKSFEAVACVGNSGKKEYPLHHFDKRANITPAMKKDIAEYLGTISSSNVAVPSNWCTYCTYRDICLKSYLKVEDI